LGIGTGWAETSFCTVGVGRKGAGLFVGREVRSSKDALYHWVKAYQERGEAGLGNQGVWSESRRKIRVPSREKIVETKKQKSFFGIQRISHLLKRVFFLNAFPETCLDS